MRTRSYCRRVAAQCRERVAAPHLAPASARAPSASMFPAARERAGARSTNDALRSARARAPRCRARRCRRTGRAPGPRSSSPSIANSASRTRSEVGRVARPPGACRRLPPSAPAITRMPSTVTVPPTAVGAALGAVARAERRREQRVLGRRQLRIAGEDRLRACPRPLEQRARPRAGARTETAPRPD